MRPALLVCSVLLVPLTSVGCDPLPSETPASQNAPPGVEPPLVGEAADADPNVERLTLRAGKKTFRDVRLEGGRLWGPRHEVQHFPDGYRGKSPSGELFLSQKEEGTVSGVIDGASLTNVSYKQDPATHRIVSDGRWAGDTFGVEISHDEIIVKRRFCSDAYQRQPNTDVFHGKPECWQAGVYGADLHVPEVFFKRPAGEQVMFLSVFLS